MKEVFRYIWWSITDVWLLFFGDDLDVISIDAKRMYNAAVMLKGYKGNIYQFIKDYEQNIKQ